MSSDYYDLHLTPLSPIHMGTGVDYEPTNYVIDEGVLFEFDSLQAMNILSSEQKKELSTIMAATADSDTLRKIQGFFYRHKDRIKTIARRHVKVNDSLQQFYQSRIGQVAQREYQGRQVQNKLAIVRTAWNPLTQTNYIPGSGLKGAMRTALLDDCKNAQKSTFTQRGLSNQKLQKELFKGEFSSDPMRLVSLSDAMPTRSQVMSEIVFELNKKKKPVRDKNGELTDSSADKGLKIQSETLSPFQPRVFKSQLELKKITAVGKDIPQLQFTLRQLASACNHFFLPILMKEVQLLKSRGFLDEAWGEAISQMMQSELIKNNHSFIIRVGRHSGAESLTLNDIRQIKIMQGGGNKPKYQSETTTMWLSNDHQQNQRDLIPFGWLLVEVKDSDLGDYPFLDKSEEHQRWYQQLDEKLVAIQKKIRQEQEKELQAEQQKQQAEKLRLKQQQQHQQKFASMTPLEQHIYKIEQDPSGNPAIALIQAVNKGKWQDEQDIRQVAQRIRGLLTEKGDWIPEFSGTNKQKKKKRQRCLEVLAWIKE